MTSLVCVVSTTRRKERNMSRFKRLSHTIGHCEYHIVWVPKYRYRVMQGKIKEEVDLCVREQTRQMNCEVQELNVQAAPCAFDRANTAEDVDLGLHGAAERQECDPGVQRVSGFARAALLGQPLLGARLLCGNRGVGRRDEVRKYVKWQEREEQRQEDLRFTR